MFFLQTQRNNRISKKIAYFSKKKKKKNKKKKKITKLKKKKKKKKKIQISREINSRILKIKNARFSGTFFCMNQNIQGDFQIYLSVS